MNTQYILSAIFYVSFYCNFEPYWPLEIQDCFIIVQLFGYAKIQTDKLH